MKVPLPNPTGNCALATASRVDERAVEREAHPVGGFAVDSTMATPPNAFILNANDYGLHAPGDQAIQALAEQGVVTSTTAMVRSSRWPVAARELRGLAIDVGLHLDFNSEFVYAPSGRAVSSIIVDCWLRRLKPVTLRTQITEQFDQFEQAMGAMPAVIDGHQHVHQFPQIRDALFDVLAKRYSAVKPAIRICISRRNRGVKAAIITALGGPTLASMATSSNCSVNSDFSGVYGFAENADLAGLWKQWLSGANGEFTPSRPLLIACHVSTERVNEDVIGAARVAEYRWLRSGEFKRLCREQNFHAVRWPTSG